MSGSVDPASVNTEAREVKEKEKDRDAPKEANERKPGREMSAEGSTLRACERAGVFRNFENYGPVASTSNRAGQREEPRVNTSAETVLGRAMSASITSRMERKENVFFFFFCKFWVRIFWERMRQREAPCEIRPAEPQSCGAVQWNRRAGARPD